MFRRIRLILALFAALLCTPLATRIAHASAPGWNAPMTFASLGVATQVLTGYEPTLDLYFPAPGKIALGPSSTLHLVYSGSPLLRRSASSITLVVNGIDVAATPVAAGGNAPHTWTVPIPAARLLTSSLNHLQLVFALRDWVPRICGIDDPNLSVTVYGSSNFQYDAGNPPARFWPALGQLPAPFVTPLRARTNIAVGLPVRPTAAELTAAAGDLARFGEDQPSQPPRVQTASPRTLPAKAGYSQLLLVGTPRDNPIFTHLAVPAPLRLRGGLWRDRLGRPLPAGEGVILEAPNPWNVANGALAISGNGQLGVARASKVVASGTLRGFLHGPYALVSSTPREATLPAPDTSEMTLAQLGYKTATVQGMGEHDLRYTFDLLTSPSKSGTLDVIYGHSDTAVQQLSSIRVDLNGLPLASRNLSSGDRGQVDWQVPLPSDQLQAGANVLTVIFFLKTPGADCSLAQDNSVWGTLDARSTLRIPLSTKPATPDLHLLPFPLVVNGSAAGTLLVVPDRTDNQRGALELAAMLGASVQDDEPRLLVKPASAVTAHDLATHTVVLDGLASDNPLVRRVAPYLPVRASSALQIVGASRALGVTVQEAGSAGLAEELASPWRAGALAVVFTATRSALLHPIRRLVLHDDGGGTVTLISGNGRVQTFDTNLVSPVGPAPTGERPIKLLALGGLALFLALAGLTLLDRRRTGRPMR